MMNLESYEVILKKYSITDCAVRAKDMFVFVVSEILTDEELEEYEEEGLDQFYRPKKIVSYFKEPDENGDQWFQSLLIGWDTPRIGACNKPRNHSITIELSTRLDDRVFITGSGPVFEDRSSLHRVDGGYSRGAIGKIKTINGWAYIAGGNRTLGKFLDKGQWKELSHNLPQQKQDRDDLNISGFNDVDGFNETDIYAGGGKGDLWHFDGENWEPIPFPTNDNIFSLCCAGDGYVYVCCTHGMTFKGRGDNWKKISNGKGEKSFRDMVWHKDRVYCTNDYGLWTIKDDELEKTDVPDEIFACSGHLYANDGVMLLAGLGGAAYCEDGEWTLLYNSSTMDTLLAVKEMEEKANTTQ